jgi:hypothetical protein
MTATLFPRPPPATLRHARSARVMSPRPACGVPACLLVVVERVNDIEFLRRPSARLAAPLC